MVKKKNGIQFGLATSSAWCQMDEVIQCAECGKKILYGDGYTSRKIHNVSGMGYVVCERCYDKEREEEMCMDS